MNLLLLSNSKSPGSPYLGHAIDAIAGIVGSRRTVCFVPFAAVTVSWDDFTAAVSAALARSASISSACMPAAPSRNRRS